MNLGLLNNKWLLGICGTIVALAGLVLFGVVGILSKCYYYTSTQDVLVCHHFYTKTFWTEQRPDAWYDYEYVNKFREEFILEPGGYLIEKVFRHPQYPADFSDDRILVGAAHNIFVGRIVREIGTKERGIGPETQFEVEIIDSVKGKLEGTAVVNQLGGYKDGRLYLVEGDIFTDGSDEESLLQIGSTYLFVTRYSPTENWNTLVSFPGANRLLSTSESSIGELKSSLKHDFRVERLKEVYPHEILLEADVHSNNTINSFISFQTEEKAIQESKKPTEDVALFKASLASSTAINSEEEAVATSSNWQTNLPEIQLEAKRENNFNLEIGSSTSDNTLEDSTSTLEVSGNKAIESSKVF